MKRLSSLFVVVLIAAAAVMSTACGTSYSVAGAMVQGRFPGEVVANVSIKDAPEHLVYLICTNDGALLVVPVNLEKPPEGAVGNSVGIGIPCGDRLKAKTDAALEIKAAAQAYFRGNPDNARHFKVDWNAIDQELREAGRY